jgi:hypothetical protein
MAARNRVTPFGDIVATPLRGAWTGNRGQLHRGNDIVRFHGGDLWITCALRFRDRRYEQWQPGHYTFLYFYDEAVSLAAGHRPCADCRRPSYHEFRTAWATELGGGLPSAKDMDRRLHRERIVPGTHRRRLHSMAWPGLPDGTFVSVDGTPFLVLHKDIVEWTPRGYTDRRARPATGDAEVITPPSTVAVLRRYPPQIDPSAHVFAGASRAPKLSGNG